MSLPPFLVKKLISRGLLQKPPANKKIFKPEVSQGQNEEIIAEDYDEMEDPPQYDLEPIKKPKESFWRERMKRRIVEGNNTGYLGCPNKYNIYHKCTLYCVTQWGDGHTEKPLEHDKFRVRLLRKYPLPQNWKEIYDCGCGSHYYWNMNDDSVSWLPPSHPKAEISKSAAMLRKELEENQLPFTDDPEPNGVLNIGSHDLTEDDLNTILNFPLPPLQKNTESLEPKIPIQKKPKSRDLEKTIKHQKAKRQKREFLHRHNEHARHPIRRMDNDTGNDPLDPMDPASYSDIPRGKWSDGLNIEGAQKSGVDSTVTGTMYQQRPYPAPGAVLKANAAAATNNNNNFNNKIINCIQPNNNDVMNNHPNDNFDDDKYY